MHSNIFDMTNGGFCAQVVTCAVLGKPNVNLAEFTEHKQSSHV